MDLKIKTVNKFATMTAAVALLAFGATGASANGVNGGTMTAHVSASVANAVTLTETNAMSFGTLVVISDGTGSALDAVMSKSGVVTWPAAFGNGTLGNEWGKGGGGVANNVGVARIFPTGAGTIHQGTYTVTNAAFFAYMGIIYNTGGGTGVVGTAGTAPIELTCGACTNSPPFLLDTFTDNTSGGTGTFATDGTGTAVIQVGATLHADNGANTPAFTGANGFPAGTAPNATNMHGTAGTITNAYGDGSYTGTFGVSVVY